MHGSGDGDGDGDGITTAIDPNKCGISIPGPGAAEMHRAWPPLPGGRRIVLLLLRSTF